MEKNISENDVTLSPNFDLAGGDNQECKTNFQKLKQESDEHFSQFSGDGSVMLQNELVDPYGQNPFSVNLDECNGIDDLCDKIWMFAENCTSLSNSTIQRHIRNIRLMADKENAIPVDFFNPSYPQYLYHMNLYRKQKYDEVTGKNFYGLKQRKYAFDFFS